MNINQLPTPCLLIEQDTMRRNIANLASHIKRLGCHIRPHVKTHKSVEITQEIVAAGSVKGITVSTLKEARHFFTHGFTDILYAVGIVPSKFEQVRILRAQGCQLTVILDSREAAQLLCEYARLHSCEFAVLIELDVDAHRAGVEPTSKVLIEIATLLSACAQIELQGVMTHAGGSYDCDSFSAQQALAKQERDLSLLAARRIRDNGIACPVVSIGSTPTAFAIDNLDGITEVRAGVYVLFDLVMAGLGVCKLSDIAISVLGSVIGSQKHKQRLLTDSGWMAMSRDRGTQSQYDDYAYGAVCTAQGKLLTNIILQSANQEHGIVGLKNKSDKDAAALLDQFKIGDQLRVLPNHACATAGQYDSYYLVSGTQVLATLPSIKGW